MNLLAKLPELQALTEYMSSQVPHAGRMSPYVREAAINTASTKTKIEMWHEYGDKSFLLSGELVEAFQHTDVPMELFPSDFMYPFECFTIESDTPLFETNRGHIDIDGRRIDDNRAAPVHTLMYISGRYIEKIGGKYIRPDGTEATGLEWDRSLSAFFPGDMAGLETILLNLKDNMTVLEATKTKKEGLLVTDLEEVDARNLVNIFYNTVMYINDPNRVPAETEEHRRRKVKLKGRKKAVKMGYIYLRPPKNYVPLGTTGSGTGHKLEKRVLVRGHYREQACGPKFSMRRRTWIHPFWKGPEWTERLSKPYKVDA